jgi:hypothetical protein
MEPGDVPGPRSTSLYRMLVCIQGLRRHREINARAFGVQNPWRRISDSWLNSSRTPFGPSPAPQPFAIVKKEGSNGALNLAWPHALRVGTRFYSTFDQGMVIQLDRCARRSDRPKRRRASLRASVRQQPKPSTPFGVRIATIDKIVRHHSPRGGFRERPGHAPFDSLFLNSTSKIGDGPADLTAARGTERRRRER